MKLRSDAILLAIIWVVVIAVICFSMSTAAETKDSVRVPRALTIIGCETIEYVTIEVPVKSIDPKGEVFDDPTEVLTYRVPMYDIPEGFERFLAPPVVHNFHDLEWNVVDGKLDCKREIVDLTDEGELQGAPTIGADFARAIGCQMAAMSYAPKWADSNPGWWPIAIGCPNPLYSDNGTPDDGQDDYIVGYKMPECPSDIKGMIIKCTFDESAI